MKLNEALVICRQGARIKRLGDPNFYVMYINGHLLRRSLSDQRWSMKTEPFISTLEETHAEDWTKIEEQPSEANDPRKQFTYSSECYKIVPGITTVNQSLNLAV